MFVGLADRGKSTLLNHLRWVNRMDRIPVGWRERMCQENSGKISGQPGILSPSHDVWLFDLVTSVV